MNRIKLFGGAVLDAEAGPITGRAAQRHRIALLALLVTTRRTHRSRDQLVGLLWPESQGERGRKLLSDSIYRVNQALGGDVIVGAGEDVRLNRNQLASDVAEFESACDAREWQHAVDLYSGPFLDGFFLPDALEFDQWLESERAQYARNAAKAYEAFAIELSDAGRKTESVECWQRLAAMVPDDSRVAMGLMKAFEASGNRAGALRHARIHATLLRETLGVEPDRAVLELAEAMAAPDYVAERVTPPEVNAIVVPADITELPVSDSVAPLTDALTSQSQSAMVAIPANAVTPTSRFAAVANSADAVTRNSIRTRPTLTLAGVVAVLIAVVLFGLKQFDRTSTTDAVITPALGGSVAVLPFTNLSESDTNAYFADGLSEELMYLLSSTPGLRVASRTSAFAYRDLKLDVRELAQRLHVDWVLEGSVRRSGDKLRIVARLTDAKNGYQVWADSYNRTSSDIFAIQEEIAAAIAGKLSTLVGDGIVVPLARSTRGATNPATYDVYLQARFQWHRRTEGSLRQSVKLFEQVVAREPGYARAWSGLADGYAVAAFYDYLPPQVAYPRADSAARRAITIDSTLAAPYATLAYVDTYYRWDWTSAEQGFKRAIALEPNYSTAHQWYGNLLTARGRFADAEREMRRASELDPLSLIANCAVGWVFMFNNENERAIQHMDAVLRLDSTFHLAHLWKGLALEQSGKPSEALPPIRRALELSGGTTLILAALAHAQASAGHVDSARVILTTLLNREKAGAYISSFDLAKMHLALGDTAKSLDRLERAYADRAHSMAFLKVDPQLRSLAGVPRFQKLVEQVEQPTR